MEQSASTGPAEGEGNQIGDIASSLVSALTGEDSSLPPLAKPSDEPSPDPAPCDEPEEVHEPETLEGPLEAVSNELVAAMTEEEEVRDPEDREAKEEEPKLEMDLEGVSGQIVEGVAGEAEPERKAGDEEEQEDRDEDSIDPNEGDQAADAPKLDLDLKATSEEVFDKILNNEEDEKTSAKSLEQDVSDTLDAIIQKISEEEEKAEEVEQRAVEEEEKKEEVATAVEGDGEEEVLITAVEDPAQRPETAPDMSGVQDEDSEPEPEPEDDIPPVPIAKYSDEELHAALDKMLKKRLLPEMEMRPSVVDYAKKQSLYQLMCEDYDQAARIDEAVDVMMQSLHKDEANYDCSQQTLSLKQKLEVAQSQNKQIQEEYNQRIAQFKEMENQRLEQLQQQHEVDRRALEADWSRPEAMLAFNKPSTSLLQLRRMQKSLAISHHFAQAKQLKIAGDQMQKEETAQANRKAVDAMRVAYAKLLEKQEKEIQCFMENGQRKLTALETERDRRLKANENLRNQLDTRVKGPKQPRRPTVTVPQVVSRGEARSSITGVITYRTRSQFAGYKKATEKTRLDVKLGDVQKITKPMTPSPRKGQRKPLRFM